MGETCTADVAETVGEIVGGNNVKVTVGDAIGETVGVFVLVEVTANVGTLGPENSLLLSTETGTWVGVALGGNASFKAESICIRPKP